MLLAGLLAAASAAAADELRTALQAELSARHAAAPGVHAFPGATLAVALPDGRVLEFAAGLAVVSPETPMVPASRMPSGSIGKTFVAALALRLAEEGALDLDDRLADWLGDEPWFDRLPNADSITLRQLLNHSSGLIDHVFDAQSEFGDYFRREVLAGAAGRGLDPRELVRFVLDREPLFAPGEGFHYSDTNYILAGLVIERAGGESYYAALGRRLLEPLDLSSTTPLVHRQIDRLAQGYAPESSELFGLPLEVAGADGLVFDPAVEWTGGGLVTTPTDLVRFAKALFERDVLQPESLDAMLTSIARPDRRNDDPERAYGYGLGISVAHTPAGVAYRHGGFFPGYNSLLAYYPVERVAIAMQVNSDRSEIEAHVDALVRIVVDHLASSGDSR